MKTLCISGIAHPSLHEVAQQLFNSGISPARPSPRSGDMDIGAWHERVLANHASGTQIGRFWEQLAADIFLGNLEAPVWGWVNPRSVELLDFWHHFDSHVYFVLVCISPQQALAHAIAHQVNNTSPDEVLQHWNTSHEAILRFHLRHPECSIMVRADEALTHAPQLINTLAAKWALPLQFSGQLQGTETQSTDAVAEYLADQLLIGRTVEPALQQEILASLSPLAEGNTVIARSITTDTAITAYQHLLDRSQEAAKIAALLEEKMP